MDKIEKALQKLSPKERNWVDNIIEKLNANNTKDLNVKKLRGRDDIFRVRKGGVRIMYRKDPSGKIFVLSIERRSEDTYR